MGLLTLIRHGQAAALEADSDRLTPLGYQQAEALAEHLLSEGARFDAVLTGSLRRQQQTERVVAARYSADGRAWPKPISLSDWNEYDAGGIMEALSANLRATDPAFAALYDDLQLHAESPDRNRYFQRMFEALMQRWVQGDAECGEVESFADFHGRVSRGRRAVLAGEYGRSVAVFTSGGPIGVCVQETLEAPAPMAVSVNWRVRNASLTELIFSTDRVALNSFNRIPHLAPDKRSFR